MRKMNRNPGDPTATDDFLALRAEQRLLLRRIPDWILRSRATPIVDVAVDPKIDAWIAERGIRMRASEVARFVDEDGLLQRLAAETESAAVYAALRSAHDVLERGLGDVLGDEMQSASNRRQAANVPDSDVPSRPIAMLVDLLLFADALAGDGYRDPRVAT